MKPLYKTVIICSEDDLPKNAGQYFVHLRNDKYSIFDRFVLLDLEYEKSIWLRSVDWYLLPTEIKFPSEVSPRVAKLIIQIRDLFIDAKDTPLDTMDEIWHLLYQIASPNYDKLCEDVWSELEEIANNKIKEDENRTE